MRGVKEAVDFLYDGKEGWMLAAPFIRGVATHGTGCTTSAAITAGLARGLSLVEAVALAKDYITQAIARHVLAGGHPVLDHQWSRG